MPRHQFDLLLQLRREVFEAVLRPPLLLHVPHIRLARLHTPQGPQHARGGTRNAPFGALDTLNRSSILVDVHPFSIAFPAILHLKSSRRGSE